MNSITVPTLKTLAAARELRAARQTLDQLKEYGGSARGADDSIALVQFTNGIIEQRLLPVGVMAKWASFIEQEAVARARAGKCDRRETEIYLEEMRTLRVEVLPFGVKLVGLCGHSQATFVGLSPDDHKDLTVPLELEAPEDGGEFKPVGLSDVGDSLEAVKTEIAKLRKVATTRKTLAKLWKKAQAARGALTSAAKAYQTAQTKLAAVSYREALADARQALRALRQFRRFDAGLTWARFEGVASALKKHPVWRRLPNATRAEIEAWDAERETMSDRWTTKRREWKDRCINALGRYAEGTLKQMLPTGVGYAYYTDASVRRGHYLQGGLSFGCHGCCDGMSYSHARKIVRQWRSERSRLSAALRIALDELRAAERKAEAQSRAEDESNEGPDNAAS